MRIDRWLNVPFFSPAMLELEVKDLSCDKSDSYIFFSHSIHLLEEILNMLCECELCLFIIIYDEISTFELGGR